VQELDAHNSPQEAAEHLVEFALKLGSTDNVTVIVVQFHTRGSF
jgi:serine/threonine protein phosphatase PrpC